MNCGKRRFVSLNNLFPEKHANQNGQSNKKEKLFLST
jgi:hypothetical protein